MIKAKFSEKKLKKVRSFFDLSAKDKKKMIQETAKEANKIQADLVKKYNVLNLK